MPIFKLTLQKTYFKQGFFNVIVDYDRYVRKANGPVRLRLARAACAGIGNQARRPAQWRRAGDGQPGAVLIP